MLLTSNMSGEALHKIGSHLTKHAHANSDRTQMQEVSWKSSYHGEAGKELTLTSRNECSACLTIK